LSEGYRQALTKGMHKTSLVLLITIALPVSGFLLAGQLGNVFFPSADRDQFEIYVWLPEGTSLEYTRRVVADMDEDIRARADVSQVSWLVGGSTPSVYYNQVMTRDNTPHFANGVGVVTAKLL
jgi:multidrug efflux pump subunit AcrB